VIFQQERGEEGTAAPIAPVAPVAIAVTAKIPVLSIATPKHHIQHSLTQMCNALKDTPGICVPRVLLILFDKERTVNIAKAAQT